MITEMTHMKLDVDGHSKTLYAYIIPQLSHPLILGKPWMEKEDVVYVAKTHCIQVYIAFTHGKNLKVWE